MLQKKAEDIAGSSLNVMAFLLNSAQKAASRHSEEVNNVELMLQLFQGEEIPTWILTFRYQII